MKKIRKKSFEEIASGKPDVEKVKKKSRLPIYALLDNIRSLHNVGAIFRTADGVMLKKLYLCGITGTPPRNEISKTALGAEKIVPWEYDDDVIKLLKRLKKEGISLIAVELTHGGKAYNKVDFSFPACFIFGHEVLGISDKVMGLVDMAIEIPMLGRANSLNVATAFGIIMYKALEKYNSER